MLIRMLIPINSSQVIVTYLIGKTLVFDIMIELDIDLSLSLVLNRLLQGITESYYLVPDRAFIFDKATMNYHVGGLLYTLIT